MPKTKAQRKQQKRKQEIKRQEQQLQEKLLQKSPQQESSPQGQKPWSWHIMQNLQWALSSGFVLGLLSVAKLPFAMARPVVGYQASRVDTKSGELMRQDARRLQACVNSTLALPQVQDTQSSQIFCLGLNNGTLLEAWVGPTQTAYPGIFAQQLDANNQPLLPATGTEVDTGTWTKGNPYIIETEIGPVFCYNTVTVADQAYCVPYSSDMQAMATPQNVAVYTGHNQWNVRGAARNGGGFEIVFQDNNLDGNATHYQMVWRGYEADNVTPINNAPEVRVSTVTNSNNINGQISVNTDNSGAILWQRLLAGATNYELVMRRYNTARTLTDSSEQLLTATTLPGYDCLNLQILAITDINGNITGHKMGFIAAPNTGSTYNVYIQDLNPNFTLNGNPVNIAPQLPVGSGITLSMIPAPNNGGVRVGFASAKPGPLPQAVVLTLFANNTLDGEPLFVNLNTAQAQLGISLADRSDDGRFTVGYQCGSNVCSQTFSESPNLNTPNNITLQETPGNQAVNLNGFYVEPVVYVRNQLTVTISAPPQIISLNTSAVVPANGNVNYNSTTGVLTLSATGSNCDAVVNNLLNCLTGTLQPYQRAPFSFDTTVSDDSGLPAESAVVPANINTVNYVPTIVTNTLTIGQDGSSQFNLTITTVDGAPANEVNIFVTNFVPSAAVVQLINPATGAVLQTGLTQFTYQQYLDGAIIVNDLGNSLTPSFQLSTSSYNGPVSTGSQTIVQFYAEENILIHQVTYTATSPTDTTPLPLDDTNFLTQYATGILSSQVIYTINYGATPHGHFALCSAPDISISQFSQADINNAGTICFVPDGSGKAPSNIQVTVDDGYTLPQTTTINFKFTVLAQQTPQPKSNNNNNNSSNTVTSNLISAAKAVGGTLVGAYIGKRTAAYARNVKNCFANFVYHEAGLCYWNFSDADGKSYIDFIDKLVVACGLREEINRLIVDYKSHWCFGGEAGQELTRYAKVFAKHLHDPELECLEKAEHTTTQVYYWVKGTPLIADVLDKDKNRDIVRNLSEKILDTIAAQIQQRKEEEARQDQSSTVYKRMATMATMATLPMFRRDSPPESHTSGSSSASSDVSLDVLTPQKPKQNLTKIN